ncbi:MAG: lipoyl(octanoyl) transferase LipB [Deltaproteobacteria bacterium]|nr:lipoyl(octanoyl) transferase LipB [Deltaproteobacteria bacterium]
MRPLHVRRLGRVDYSDGLAMQAQLLNARAHGLVPDTLLLLEHPRTLTLGRGADGTNILWGRERLTRAGFDVFDTNRGGDVTYHGPGQLVGYPILDLKPDRKDVRKYVSSVEELMIRAAKDFDVEARRVDGRVGIWVETPRGPEKLGAIGVHLSKWLTSHGFAFNISTDLTDFGAIVPCGVSDAGVCSLRSLGVQAEWPRVLDRFVAHAEGLWESEAAEVEFDLQTIAVAVVREGIDGDELLLLHRVPERGAFWQLLTGRRELNESAEACALRELHEETGLSPALNDLVAQGEPHAFVLDTKLLGLGDLPHKPVFARETMFALRVPPGTEPRLSAEHDGHKWVQLDDALTMLPFAAHQRAARALLTRS